MSEKIWKNKWVCNPEFADITVLDVLHRQLDFNYEEPEHKEELKNHHTLFRKKIELTGKEKEVYLDISADDYYKLFINGTFVTQGPANSYPFCYYYNRIDIAPYLKKGSNQLAVHIYYQGLINRAYNSGDYRQGLITEVFADKRLIADDCWKCKTAKEYGASRTIAYDTQFDEIIDNRKKESGWKELSYQDEDWINAVVKTDDDHHLILQKTKNLQMESIRPVVVKELSDGYLLDFGTELTGTFFMKATGNAGDEIKILFGEELEHENAVRYELRCNCCYADRWILAAGENELEQFEYKCFRYVQLKSSSPVKMWEFYTNYRHYPFDDSGCGFQTNHELVKQIWEICKNAVKNCAQEAFLDCPHREKGQYLGDLTVTAHAFYYLTNDASLFRKALEDFAHSTQICEGMMAVAPGNFMQEIADFSLLFPYQLLLYHKFTEDAAFLREMLPVAEGIERYFSKFQNETGLLCDVKAKWNLVDWPENLRDGYDFELSQPVVGDGCHNVINALYIGMKKCIEQIKDILEISYLSEIAHLTQQFQKTFYKQETGLFVDSSISSHSSLHANVYAAFYGLEPKGNHIVELIRKKGLCCGVFVSYFLLKGLCRMGEKDLAYELITNKTEHSWYQMIQEGATTAYEAWGKDQKWNTSLCHAWAAAPIPVLMEYFMEQ